MSDALIVVPALSPARARVEGVTGAILAGGSGRDRVASERGEVAGSAAHTLVRVVGERVRVVSARSSSCLPCRLHTAMVDHVMGTLHAGRSSGDGLPSEQGMQQPAHSPAHLAGDRVRLLAKVSWSCRHCRLHAAQVHRGTGLSTPVAAAVIGLPSEPWDAAGSVHTRSRRRCQWRWVAHRSSPCGPVPLHAVKLAHGHGTIRASSSGRDRVASEQGAAAIWLGSHARPVVGHRVRLVVCSVFNMPPRYLVVQLAAKRRGLIQVFNDPTLRHLRPAVRDSPPGTVLTQPRRGFTSASCLMLHWPDHAATSDIGRRRATRPRSLRCPSSISSPSIVSSHICRALRNVQPSSR